MIEKIQRLSLPYLKEKIHPYITRVKTELPQCVLVACWYIVYTPPCYFIHYYHH